MSKKMNNFKQRIQANRGLSTSGVKISSIINIQVKEDLIVKFDRKKISISDYEAKEQILDLFTINKSVKAGEKINLSKYTDSCYDLLFKGIVRKDDMRIALVEAC